jgi:hypothetical protein
MQLCDQPRRQACRLIAGRGSVGNPTEHLDDFLRRAFRGQGGEAGCLIPRIDTRSRERRKHGHMHSVFVVGNRAEQEIIQIRSKGLSHRVSVLPTQARRYRHKPLCAEDRMRRISSPANTRRGQAGQPAFRIMSPALAESIGQQLPAFRQWFAWSGELKALTFQRVDANGGDEYRGDFAQRALRISIRLNEDSRVENAEFAPG